MISWIQNALERKGRVVFIILLAVVIVSFVFVIGETPGCVGTEPGATAQKYYGYSLNAEADPRSQQMIEEVIISSIINRGQQPQGEEMLTQEFLSRIALLHLANAAKVPEPNQEAFANYLAGLRFFQNAEGEFDPNRVTSFLDMTQLSRRFSEETINRALSNDYRIQQLMNSVAPPGFTVPFEVEEQARRSAASYDLSVARISEDSFEFSVEPTEEELADFFSQQVEAYRIPETRMLSTVSFPPASFAEKIEAPTDAQLQEYFAANRSDYLDEEAENPADALPKFEAVREQVAEDWKNERAATLAREASVNFVYGLFDAEIPMGSPAYEEYVQGYPVTVDSLPPMIGSTPPAETNVPADAFREATRLDSIRYYSDPIETDEGVVVLILDEVIPTRIPELDAVRAEVLADYRDQNRREAFVARGAELRQEITQKVSSGESFDKAAEAVGLSAESFEEIGWTNIPEGLDNSVIRRAETLPDGEVSSMILTDQGGTFLYVKDRSAPDFASDSPEYQRTQNMLSNGTSRLFISTFVGDLIQSGSAGSE